MSSFTWPSTGSGVATYANFAAFPATASDGTIALALDTDFLYAYNAGSSSWVLIAGAGSILSMGTFDSGTPSAAGAHIDLDKLVMQSASGANPGSVNITTQTFAGQKTFSTGLTGTLTGAASLNVLTSALGTTTETTSSVLTLSGWTNATVGSPTITVKQASGSQAGYLSSADWTAFNNKQSALTIGNLTDAGTDGITVTNGTGSVIGTGTSLAQHVADTSHNGYLSSIDWNTFNGKAPTGNYATSGIGDVTWSAPSGPGQVTTAAAATQNNITSIPNLATVGTLGTGVWRGTAVAAGYGGTGISTAASTGVPSISSGAWSVNSVLPATLGGTGQGSNFTQYGPFIASSTSAMGQVGTGTSGYYLTSDGSSGPPSYQQVTLDNSTVTGVLPIARGGTDNGSLAVTAGGVLYTDGSKVQNVGAGTSSQALLGGTTPAWGTPPGPTTNYWSGYFDNGNYWSTASTTFASPASGGTTPSLTARGTPTIAGVVKAASGQLGFTFTPAASTSVYLVSFSGVLVNGGSGFVGQAQLVDNNGFVISSPGAIYASSGGTSAVTVTLSGIYTPGTASAVTVFCYLATSNASNPCAIQPSFLTANLLTEFSLVQIK